MAKDYTLRLERFAGLRVSRDASYELDVTESPDMLNFKVTEGGKLKKRDGFARVWSQEGLRGIWFGSLEGEAWYLAVAGSTLYASREGFDSLSPVEGEVPGEEEISFFPFYRSLYLLTGAGIRKFDGEALCEPEPYVPLVMVATPPKGGGEVFEEVNLLTRTVRQSYSPTGEDLYFQPAIPSVKRMIKVLHRGEEVAESVYCYDWTRLQFCFSEAPPAGTDTLEIWYEISEPDVSDRIQNCRFALGFGGANDTRAFLYGNRSDLSMRYHSGVVDGKPCMEYFPETGYTLIGNGAPVTAILRHYDRQLIFTDSAAYYSYLEYQTGTNGKLVAAFPVLPLSDLRGNLAEGQALLLENDPCTISEGGLYRWISTNVRDERNAVSFSDPIAAALAEEDLRQARMFLRKKTMELYLVFDGRVYVYHSRQKLFYYYELPVSPRRFCQAERELYFCDGESIYCVGGESDAGEPIRAHWSSRALDFSEAGKEKHLFRVNLYEKTPLGGKVWLSLSTDLGETEEQVLELPSSEYVSLRSRPSALRAFRTMALCLDANGDLPLHLYGIELQGRITDQRVKELNHGKQQ